MKYLSIIVLCTTVWVVVRMPAEKQRPYLEIGDCHLYRARVLQIFPGQAGAVLTNYQAGGEIRYEVIATPAGRKSFDAEATHWQFPIKWEKLPTEAKRIDITRFRVRAFHRGRWQTRDVYHDGFRVRLSGRLKDEIRDGSL